MMAKTPVTARLLREMREQYERGEGPHPLASWANRWAESLERKEPKVIDYSHNHLKDDVDGLLKHLATACAAPDAKDRKNALFSAGLRLIRLEKEVARMSDVIAELEAVQPDPFRGYPQHVREALTKTECSCHREVLSSHELCCGHDEGRDPNCPVHGDGSRP